MPPKIKSPKRLALILVQLLFVTGILIVEPAQTVLGQRGQSGTLTALKLKARQADDNGNTSEADRLYVQAIEEAKRVGSKTDVVEMISRLVRERARNRKISQVDSYVQNALDIVKPLIGTKGYDPEMSVWMDDLADVLYEHGERTNDKHWKEYCDQRYLEVELLVRDKPNRELAGRASLFTVSLAHQGRYAEAAAAVEKVMRYLHRTSPNDLAAISFTYVVLGNSYLGAKNPAKAEQAFAQSLQASDSLKKDPNHQALIDRKISMAMFEEGKTEQAKALSAQALKLHMACAGKSNAMTAWDAFVLARFEERTNDLPSASKHYQMCLESFEKASTPSLDRADNSGNAAGQVAAAEGLAQIESKQGKKSDSRALRDLANKIRSQHPGWIASKNPDPLEFFAIWGYFPYPVEIIPTP